MHIDIADAEPRWDELVQGVEQGEEIVLSRDGKPVVKIVPIGVPNAERPGSDDGDPRGSQGLGLDVARDFDFLAGSDNPG